MRIQQHHQVDLETTIRDHKDYRLDKFVLVYIFVILFGANAVAQDYPFNFGEELKYNIYFKYGIIMAKAGTAEYRIQRGAYNRQSTVETRLTFRTTSTFDNIFKIRDTLSTYLTPDLTPIFHKKFLNEGKTEYIEDMHYQQFDKNFSKVRSMRMRGDKVRFDTILVANAEGHDILNTFLFLRQIDYANLFVGQNFQFVSFVGKDVVQMRMRYAGQTILEESEVEKYKTLRFEVDIIDASFSESKNAMEIWVSDDQNHIPVKLKAKLKIGAAEAELSSSKGLKYPFNAKVIIPVR